MSQVIPQMRIASGDNLPLKRWEFYAFVVQAFLIIGAAAVILSLARRLTIPLSAPVFAGSMFVVIALATLPVLSVVARLYYRHDIDIGATIFWAIALALLVGTIMLFVVH